MHGNDMDVCLFMHNNDSVFTVCMCACVCKWPRMYFRVRVHIFSFTVHCTCELPVEGSDESQMGKCKSETKTATRGAEEGDVLHILQC